ncbi:Dihydropteroate synthase [hydrothermal vent metagenome]|uniref:dihydropteroate synthase n=1 Tax=hydrothermal vent metagenome TaxID=652676 RepID=A0A3B1D9U2_9ZZZZ
MKKERDSPTRESPFFSAPSFHPNSGHWRCGHFLLNYQKRPLIMGILNVTPDSFSDGGQFFKPEKALEHALQLVSEGADIIDIGGESTRPGALSVPLEEEADRVLPVIRALAQQVSVPISIDTRKPEIARRAIAAGASILNDVSGLNADAEMFSVAAEDSNTALVVMHAKGSPQTMQEAPRYDDLIEEVHAFFQGRLSQTDALGISRDRIALDPGIGFGKTIVHNLSLIHKLPCFSEFGVPLLLGPSRKSFIGDMLDLPPSERLEGTAAAVAIAVFQGARILRVHDLVEMRRVLMIAEGIRKQAPAEE